MECPTRLKREEKLSESPGKRNPSERSRRSRSPGSKPTLVNKRESRKDARSSGNGERREDSYFHLCSPGNAVTTPTVSVLLECGTPSVLVNIEGTTRRVILDTGSKVSILQLSVSKNDVSVTNLKPYGVTGEALDIKGRQSVSFESDRRKFRHTFWVCELPTDIAGLLATDFMQETGAVVDFECGKMSLTGIDVVPRGHSGSPTGHTTLTVFTQGKE